MVASQLNDLWQVRIKGYQEGQQTNNVLHFLCKGATSDVETQLILKLISCFVTHLLPALANAWQLDTVVWKRVSPTLSPEFITVPPGASVGALTTDALPTFNAGLVSIRTAQGGRSKRGRMFIAGIPESATVGSKFEVTGPTWLAIGAFVTCVISEFVTNAELGADQFHLGVYSRKIGGAAFPYQLTGFTPAISLNPVALVATMRSRKVGRGS